MMLVRWRDPVLPVMVSVWTDADTLWVEVYQGPTRRWSDRIRGREDLPELVRIVAAVRAEAQAEAALTKGPQYEYHTKPIGHAGPCPVCGCAALRLRAPHAEIRPEHRVPGGPRWVKTVSTGFGMDRVDVGIMPDGTIEGRR